MVRTLEAFPLREVMAQWFFMASLTGRYTGSPESRMEQDVSLLRGLSGAADFVQALREHITRVLTRNDREVTLVNELVSAAAQSISQSAFSAALCPLDAPVLYSNMTDREVLSPTVHVPKASLERHHLFPRQYLKKRYRRPP